MSGAQPRRQEPGAELERDWGRVDSGGLQPAAPLLRLSQCSGSATARLVRSPSCLALTRVRPGASGSAFLGIVVPSIARALLGTTHYLQHYSFLLIIFFFIFFCHTAWLLGP